MKVYAVYKTDAWHSYASRDLIGIASDFSSAQLLCHEQAKKEGFGIKGDELYNLANLRQTQGYEGDGEFMFEEITLNELI